MAGQLYIGREKGLYHASHILPNNPPVCLTLINGKPVYVSELGLIGSLAGAHPFVYSQGTQLVFQENANPPITLEVRTTVSALVQRLMNEESQKSTMRADILAISSTLEPIAKKYR